MFPFNKYQCDELQLQQNYCVRNKGHLNVWDLTHLKRATRKQITLKV